MFVALAKFAGAAKEILIAARFGTSETVDAYLFVFNCINWPLGVWLSILPIVLLPLLARIDQESPPAALKFTNEVLTLSLALGTALGIAYWALLPSLIATSGLTTLASAIGYSMIGPMIVLLPLGALNVFLATRLLAAGSQVNTILEGIPALTIVVFLLATDANDPTALVWGTVLGFSIHTVLLLIRSGAALRVPSLRLKFNSPAWISFWAAIGVIGAGQALMSLTSIIDLYMASYLGAGSVAVLGYAERVIALIVGLGATAATRATLPVFSNLTNWSINRAADFAFRWAKLLFGAGVVAAFIAWVVAPWGIRILFHRGAFLESDVEAVSEVFRYGLVQIPFYFAGVVLTSLIAAHRQYKAIAAIAAICLLVKTLGNASLAPVLGIAGLALANGLMYATAFGLRVWFIRNRMSAAE
jgi:putative peptidoglycan lipid II flippase